MRQPKIDLMINGQEVVFERERLEDILNEYYDKDVIIFKIPKGVSGVEFHEVIPADINKKLFEEKRINKAEETGRKIMLDAIENYLEMFPEKYIKPFKTITVMHGFENMTIDKIYGMTKEYGGSLSNLTDLGLEWAYRISVGETWESVCADIDRGFYKLVQYEARYFFLFNGTEKKGTVDTFAWSNDDYIINKIAKKITPVIKVY